MDTRKHWRTIYKYAGSYIDILLQVVDARNPVGTHNIYIENYLREKNPKLHIIFILNKIDLIPKQITMAWTEHFENKGYDVIAISARRGWNVPYLMKKIKMLSSEIMNALIVGYPNAGKSTLIETMTRNRKKAGTSSRAGFTRAVQTFKLSEKLFLIDTPGIIPFDENNETELVMKACMNADKLEDPLGAVEAINEIISKEAFEKTYDIELPENYTEDELVEVVGRRFNRLKKGGLVNRPEAMKIIIRDWQSNKLKYYILPPGYSRSDRE